MPMYDYNCTDCAHTTEELFKISHDVPQDIQCEVCGSISYKVFPLISRTAGAWAEQTSETGGFWSVPLGQNVKGERQEEKIARSRGLVPESQLGKHFIADWTENRKREVKEENAETARYETNLAEARNHCRGDDGAAKAEAVSKTFTASDMLAKE